MMALIEIELTSINIWFLADWFFGNAIADNQILHYCQHWLHNQANVRYQANSLTNFYDQNFKGKQCDYLFFKNCAAICFLQWREIQYESHCETNWNMKRSGVAGSQISEIFSRLFLTPENANCRIIILVKWILSWSNGRLKPRLSKFLPLHRRTTVRRNLDLLRFFCF